MMSAAKPIWRVASWRGGDAGRGVGEGEEVSGEGDGAGEGEEVAEADGGEEVLERWFRVEW